ncbi:MAG: 50S ribosomal protein L24, partial [Nitrosopumilaceae archaeon]|nr:50S ribosomal protein L24 [Nitrosopumilaceae archaeon]
ASPLSKDLRQKYGKRSVRVVIVDTVKIITGEFKGVDGKVEKVSPESNSIAIAGIKKEKTKGDKFDVYIQSSNVVVTALNTEDKWRISKLEGKKGKASKSQPKETKEAPKETSKEEKSEE